MRKQRCRPAFIVLSLLLLPAVDLAGAPAAPASAGTRSRGDLAKAAVVFARLQRRSDNYDLWTMGPHGGNAYQLTESQVDDWDPAWSPDGTKIAWVRYPDDLRADVWLMNADGTGRHNLTNDADDISRPAWSPDGTQIAFSRDGAIWVIGADGSDEHRISPAGAYDFDPAWSPDGSTILFAGDSSGATFDIDLFTMRPDGTDRLDLTNTSEIIETRPAWSPDGSRIAFTAEGRTTDWHVELMRTDGAGRHILVDAYSLDPAWSPSGSRIVFYGCLDDCALFRITVNGTDLEPFGRRRGASDIEPDYRDVIPGA